MWNWTASSMVCSTVLRAFPVATHPGKSGELAENPVPELQHQGPAASYTTPFPIQKGKRKGRQSRRFLGIIRLSKSNKKNVHQDELKTS